MSVFAEGLKQFSEDPAGAPAGVFSIIADRLEEAICGDEQELRLLAEKLDDTLRTALQNLPAGTIENARAIGRLSFALELAQRALSRQPPVGFYKLADDLGWSTFYKMLLKQGRVSLSSRLAPKATKKHRKEMLATYQPLVDAGVIDFVQELGDVHFFLTPAARTYLENKPTPQLGLPDELLERWGEVDSAINRVITSLPSAISANMEVLEHLKKDFRTLIHKLAMGR